MRLYNKVYKGVVVSEFVYDSLPEFLEHNPGAEYFEYESLKNQQKSTDELKHYLESYIGKYVVASDGKVCKLLNVNYAIVRKRYSYPVLVTPFGRFMITPSSFMLERYTIRRKSKTENLFTYIQYTGSFYAAIRIVKPEIHKQAGGDPLSVLQICFKKKILCGDFFRKLKLLMGDNIASVFDESELPIKTAKGALEKIMNESGDESLVARVALRIYEIGLEFEKAKMDMTAATQPPSRLPMNPFAQRELPSK